MGKARKARRLSGLLLSAVLLLSALFLAGFVPEWGAAKASASEKANAAAATASIPDLVEKLSPAVVNIATTRVVKNRLTGRDVSQQGMGSGLIISADGYIFTNHHVVNKADRIKVKLADEKEYDATVKGQDAATDLALLKIDPDAELPFAALGDSDRCRIGETVFTIGNPLGLNHTITAGIMSRSLSQLRSMAG